MFEFRFKFRCTFRLIQVHIIWQHKSQLCTYLLSNLLCHLLTTQSPLLVYIGSWLKDYTESPGAPPLTSATGSDGLKVALNLARVTSKEEAVRMPHPFCVELVPSGPSRRHEPPRPAPEAPLMWKPGMNNPLPSSLASWLSSFTPIPQSWSVPVPVSVMDRSVLLRNTLFFLAQQGILFAEVWLVKYYHCRGAYVNHGFPLRGDTVGAVCLEKRNMAQMLPWAWNQVGINSIQLIKLKITNIVNVLMNKNLLISFI